ncbi:HTH-type transcriptional regulator BhcR [Cognatishimia sp. MH4019]|uniref:HTH-type transcriptional regulator BhcR n=1 Tax=Cognatishimia sp. MH4019 TaxID=2854030 RepID=UPI001CD80210|nr:HTH-type transcriptional regulator BhcR [Cognatishimia sp. MH4019]
MAEKRARGRPRAFNDKSEQNRVQSLDRALDILDYLAIHPGATLSEIASDLEQSAATVYRVLSTFAGRDVVEFEEINQTWAIGAGAFRMGSAFLRRTSVVERARPTMAALMDSTGETANLGVERGGKVLFISQVETHESIRAFFPPGTQSQMHASGIGKALLSTFDPQKVARIMRATPMEAFTGKTLTSLPALEAELETIRAQGYSFDDEEKTTGMRCVAAPVRDASGLAVAGLSVSGPTSRMTDAEIPRIATQVMAAARSLSESLGA